MPASYSFEYLSGICMEAPGEPWKPGLECVDCRQRFDTRTSKTRASQQLVGQQFGKHNTLATVSSGNRWTVRGGDYYSVRLEIPWEKLQSASVQARVEAGSNTSTVTLRVVGDDEKGSLQSETVKYGHETKETRTQEGLLSRGPVAYTKTDPSSRQRGRPHKNRTVIVKQ
jgi:hypothetical protein